jgi:alpha-tubulin suppressor-like RCC1 family protein
VSVQDGLGSGCAALADGTVKCWLLDLSKSPGAGQLGNGSTAPPAETDEPFRATPVVVEGGAPLSNIRAMADGVVSPASCAITNDGQLYCWGDLTWIVGGGTTIETGTARLVTIDGTSPLTGVIRVALGGRQACALRHGASGNEVWCWGYGAKGELGQEDGSDQPYPVKVSGLEGPTAIAIAAEYDLEGPSFADATACAVVEGGQVRCWGSDAEGALGSNRTTTEAGALSSVVDGASTPVAGVSELEAGFGGFSALRTDGSLWVWGYANRPYAASFATGVAEIGYGPESGSFGPFYLTRDGAFHIGQQTVPIVCPADR